MFLAVLLVAIVAFLFFTVSNFKDTSLASSPGESETFVTGSSSLNELVFELSKAMQGGNDTVLYIAIGVTVGIAVAIDMLARRFI